MSMQLKWRLGVISFGYLDKVAIKIEIETEMEPRDSLNRACGHRNIMEIPFYHSELK